MQVEFRESFAYGAWIVSSNFGTQASYRIYIRVLYPSGSNWFANKHLGDDAAKILKRRTFQGVSEPTSGQSGQPLCQSVNSLGTAVIGRALNRYNAWAAIKKRANRRIRY